MSETDHLGELGAGGMIILKRIFKKRERVMNCIDLGQNRDTWWDIVNAVMKNLGSKMPGSSVGIATGYGLDGPWIESRWGARFFAPVQTGPGAHPAPCTMGTGSFPGVKSGRGRDADPSHPSSAAGHERVELYLYSPYGPYGLYRASVPVQGCIWTRLFFTWKYY